MKKRISILLCLIILTGILPNLIAREKKVQKKEKEYPKPSRFEKAIIKFEAEAKKTPPPEGAIVCIGSSSMKGWHRSIKKDLAPLTIIPRGFGGSYMNDALFYLDRIVTLYKPRAVVVYEGDNDIARGIKPEKVRDTFNLLVNEIHKKLPETRVYFLSIKPSISRWKVWPQMKEANSLIEKKCNKNKLLIYIDVSTPMLNEEGTPKKDIYRTDNLHMNSKGYAIWKKAVRDVLNKTEEKYESTNITKTADEKK
jgi:lysophospholipase L1-like esterase